MFRSECQSNCRSRRLTVLAPAEIGRQFTLVAAKAWPAQAKVCVTQSALEAERATTVKVV